MDEQINNNKTELGGLSLRDIFYKYIRFLPLFLVSVALALLVAFLYLRYATQIYSAGGSMVIKNEKGGPNNDKVEDLLAGNNRSQNIQSEIEILRSRPLMARVVKKLNLQFSYTAKGKIKGLNVYKRAPFVVRAYEITDSLSSFNLNIRFSEKDKFHLNGESLVLSFGELFRNKHGVFSLVQNGEALSNTEYTISWRPTEAVASSMVKNLKIQPKTAGTGILNIGFEATSGQLAADVINSLMAEYDLMTVENNNASTDQMLAFIEGRLGKFKAELDSVQAIELRLREKYKIFDIEAQSASFLTTLKEVGNKISEQELRIAAIEQINDYVADKMNRFNRVVPSSMGLEDVTLNELVGSYNKAQLERQILLNSGIPSGNSAIKQAEAVIEKQRENLQENLRNIKLSFLSVIGTLRTQSMAEEGQLTTFPYKLKDLLEIQRQISTKLVLYNLLEQKKEEASISRASTISNSAVIDKAMATSEPIKPNRKTIQILAIVIGLGLPALIIFLVEVMNDKISTRGDIEKITKAPIIGEVGHSFSENVLVVNKMSRSMVAEQFRIIRSNLQYVLNKNERPVILVTSSFSGEGKSFLSTNMGSVLSLTGKKTVILEFDIRKPKVLSGLGMPKKPGISNFLAGKAELKDLIVQVPEQEDLFILPCGPIPPNPAELLLDPGVAEMFAWLRKEFEVVIIDTAPVGMVSDAMTLGKFADCTLYLVRQGRTFKKQVGLIDDLYISNKLPKISVVINDVKNKPGYGYYGYGRYGYGYGYGGKSGYYEEETPRDSFFTRLRKSFSRRKTK